VILCLKFKNSLLIRPGPQKTYYVTGNKYERSENNLVLSRRQPTWKAVPQQQCAICAAKERTYSRMFCVCPNLHLTVIQDLEREENYTLTGEHRQNGSHSPSMRSIYRRLCNRMYTNLKNFVLFHIIIL
jgi:hypothetical protein